MFLAIFGTVLAVLATGLLFVNVIAPNMYSYALVKGMRNDIEQFLSSQDIDLADYDLLKYSDSDELSEASLRQFARLMDKRITNQALQRLDMDDLLIWRLSSMSLRNAAIIEIYDAQDQLIYQPPLWMGQLVRDNRLPGGIDNFARFLSASQRTEDDWIKRSMPLSADGDYTMTVRINIADFNRNMTMIRGIFRNLLLVGMVMAAICSLILSRVITRPLKKLRNIAIQMEKMDFTCRYEGRRNDEIGQLGQTLNHMMDRLGTNLQQLQAELDKEKQSDRLRREFVAQVSHELKTPIAVVSNYVEALQDGMADSDEEQMRYYDIIEGECHKIGRMIHDLLDLSQMEAGTYRIQRDDFDMMQSLARICDKYREFLPSGITLCSELDDRPVMIHGDMLRMEQVVENLMTNALKHVSAEGEIQLIGHREGTMLHIQVINEGDSIPDDILPRVWEAFSKGSDEQGTGLGLSIVRNIINLHDGEYYVRNGQRHVVFGVRVPVASPLRED